MKELLIKLDFQIMLREVYDHPEKAEKALSDKGIDPNKVIEDGMKQVHNLLR